MKMLLIVSCLILCDLSYLLAACSLVADSHIHISMRPAIQAKSFGARLLPWLSQPGPEALAAHFSDVTLSRLRNENTSDHPHPPYLQKNMPQKYAIRWGSVWHKSRLKSRGFYPLLCHLNRSYWDAAFLLTVGSFLLTVELFTYS